MALVTIKIERKASGPGQPRRRRSTRRLVAVGAAVGALVAGFVVSTGLAQASVVSIPPKVVASSVSVPAATGLQVIVSGGATTVPTDATRVVMSATVTGASTSNLLTAFPTGNPSGASGDSLHYVAGTTSTGTFTEPVGLSNKVSFVNHGTSAITLTVKDVGYSTDVRASDIAPDGGSAGQVLTNTGTGAAWRPVGHAYGVANPFTVQALNTSLATVASVSVPAGSYSVTFSTTIAGSTSASPDNVGCYLFTPGGNEVNGAYGNTYATDDQSVITMQGLVSNTTGGTINAQCVDTDGSASVFYPTLIANSVGSVDGYSGTARAHLKRIPNGPTAVHK